ncbi:ATP-binding protein [Peribacillus frigoritolerans]|uniref:VirB4-like conjugal transfer ATPase, CD1110 family n=1 Tax=Peribacillus frigoritolerans TaxID=450367 RepID=UPI0021A582EB|nr:ATP-binding protein [Peribacillus frigoritolerans]MCT1389852.1 ATP-binding protein [Peribacillus frigoritolerans]
MSKRLEKLNLFQVFQRLVDSKKNQRKSTQDTLNYQKMYPDGVCHVGGQVYNRMIRFSDISYQLSQDEKKQKIFALYSTLLNSFDDTIKIQFCFINYRINSEDNEKEVLVYSKSNSNIEDFELLRNEYFSFLEEQKQKGNNGIVRNKYLVFSIKDKSDENAARRLSSIENNINDHFKKMGVGTEELNGIERLSIMNYLLNGNTKHHLELGNLTKEQLKGVTTKDLIAPKVVRFDKDKDEFEINNKIGATLHLKIVATELSDRVLADFLDLDLEMLVSMHIRSLGQPQAVRMVKSKTSDLDSIKIEEQKKALRSGYDMDILPTDLNMHVEESRKILSDLQRENERYFYLTFTITVFEKNRKDLDNAIFRLSNIAQKQNCTLVKMKFQQEKALISALPLGENLNESDLERGLTTSSTAIFVPFTTQELYQEEKEPVYYGLNALSNNVIQVSRKALKNPNGLFLGTPGSGKSFSAKREMIDTFLRTKDDILICDPEGEYYPFVKRLGGKEIKISLNSTEYINPLDISLEYGEGENPISFKSDFIINLMELIAGGKTGLSARQKTIVDKSVRIIYRPYLESPSPENIPILEDLYNVFVDTGKAEGQELADALELYVSGSLNVFNHPTTIDTNNRLVCFNIQELGSNLRELGMLILQDYVWNKVTVNRNRDKKTWYYMDEFHKLLAEEQTSNYSVEFWKRFRKWGGIPTGITQNVKDLLSSPKIETIIDNTDFVYLLNQAASDRAILQQKFEISDYQANYITNSNEGEGLLVYSGNILPFKDKFPHNNSLYPVMTTKPEEIKRLRGSAD